MKAILSVLLLALLPALTYAQRESYKSSSKYNSAAGRVSDKEKAKAMAEKFNGQQPDQPTKPMPAKPTTGKQPVQGPTQNGGRVKNPKTKNGNV